MKTTILTLATIGLLFTSCTKEDELQPVVSPVTQAVVTPSEPCMSTEGVVISRYGYGAMIHTDGYHGYATYMRYMVTVATSCDTLKGLRYYSSFENPIGSVVEFKRTDNPCFNRRGEVVSIERHTLNSYWVQSVGECFDVTITVQTECETVTIDKTMPALETTRDMPYTVWFERSEIN
tara:strand:+ start:540 stop:1073 length:534 start_codon:yes stop_codon:yes gene_type:complete